MDDWLVALIGLLMWAQGFVFGGILYGKTPFWDGVRSVYRLGLGNAKRPAASR